MVGLRDNSYIMKRGNILNKKTTDFEFLVDVCINSARLVRT